MKNLVKAIEYSMNVDKVTILTAEEMRLISNLQRANYCGLLKVDTTCEGQKVLTWPFIDATLACPYDDDAFHFSRTRVYDEKNKCIKGKVEEHFSSNSGMVKLLPRGIDHVKNLLIAYSIHVQKHLR